MLRQIALVLLVVAGISISAPVSALDYFQIGIKGGVNLARLNDDGIVREGFEGLTGRRYDQAFRIGAVVGGFAQFELTRSFLVRPEVLFTMKGEKYEPVTEGGFSAKLDYIEVPLLAVYRFPLQGDARPGIYVGPAVGLEVSSKVQAEMGEDSFSGPLGRTKSLDFSLVVGGELAVGDQLTLEARLTQGFTDVDDTGAETKVSNQTISVLAGLAFDVFNY